MELGAWRVWNYVATTSCYGCCYDLQVRTVGTVLQLVLQYYRIVQGENSELRKERRLGGGELAGRLASRLLVLERFLRDR